MENDLVFQEYPNYGKHLADSYFHRSDVWSSCHRFEAALPTNDVDTNNLCEASFKVCINVFHYLILLFTMTALPLNVFTGDEGF